jgi:cytochrome b
MLARDSLTRTEEPPKPTRLWDVPVRLFHWLLVALFGLSWATAEYGLIEIHRLSGYSILTLVLFRIYWAFAGSTTARFKHFLRGPKTVIAHMSTIFHRDEDASAGHNPLGGWNVVAMLLLLLVQTGLGLFAIDDFGIESGPFAHYISFETAKQVTALHETVFNILLVLIALHVVAVLGHLAIKRENLIMPMITGNKALTPKQAGSLTLRPLWQGVIAAAVCAAFVAVLVNVL